MLPDDATPQVPLYETSPDLLLRDLARLDLLWKEIEERRPPWEPADTSWPRARRRILALVGLC